MLTSTSIYRFYSSSKPRLLLGSVFVGSNLYGRGIHLRENNTDMFRPKKMFRSMKFLWPFLHALFYKKLALKLRLVTKRVTRKMELDVYGDALLILCWLVSISCLSLDSFAFTYLHFTPPNCFACIGFGHCTVWVGAFCSNGENGWPSPRPRRGRSPKFGNQSDEV